MKNKGFTIVELLIVIVVIGILAAISVVAYNGVQNRANDTVVQSDLKSIAKKLELYKAEKTVYPAGDTQLLEAGLAASTKSYGNGFADNLHNLLYCRLAAAGPTEYALIASSKSGAVFTYRSSTGAITSATAWASTASTTNCQGAGINQTIGSDRDILFYQGAWMPYVKT